MAPKYHPTPLSGGDRKALAKELIKGRAMTRILADRANEKRAAGEASTADEVSPGCFGEQSRSAAFRSPVTHKRHFLSSAGLSFCIT